MIILVHKSNNETIKRYLIPKNASFNCKRWVDITINVKEEVFVAQKIVFDAIKRDEWVEKEDYTFPSSLFNEFLRLDFEDDDLSPTLKGLR